MNSITGQHGEGEMSAIGGYADRLDLLARAHDREPDLDFIDGLRNNSILLWFAEPFESEPVSAAISATTDALAMLPDPLEPQSCDELATEYADIYLTYAYRISPCGSVWLTDDNLDRQAPMFDVRSWYRKYGVEVPDWRSRPDDHIVHQIQFLALLLRQPNSDARRAVAEFLDDSLLKWLPEFAHRMAERATSPLYIGIAQLTLAVVEEIRDVMEHETGISRPQPEPERPRKTIRKNAQIEISYLPGVAESW